MRLIKNIKTLFLLVFLLLLASCVDNGLVRDPDEFKTGTEGVEVEFVENTPPDNVRENSQFNIALDVVNEGAYTADRAYVNLGLERSYMCVLSGEECEGRVVKEISNLQGKTPSTPRGDFETLRFDAETKSLEPQRTRHPATAILTLCYNYKTGFESQVCINPPAPGERETAGCTEETRTYSDQGAPIAITKVESDTSSREGEDITPKVTFHVENAGDGRVIDKDKVSEMCTGGELGRRDRNNVHLEELQIGNNIYERGGEENDIECRKEKIELTGHEGRITCEMKNSISEDSPAYEARIMAVFEYGYSESYTREIEIEK